MPQPINASAALRALGLKVGGRSRSLLEDDGTTDTEPDVPDDEFSDLRDALAPLVAKIGSGKLAGDAAVDAIIDAVKDAVGEPAAGDGEQEGGLKEHLGSGRVESEADRTHRATRLLAAVGKPFGIAPTRAMVREVAEVARTADDKHDALNRARSLIESERKRRRAANRDLTESEGDAAEMMAAATGSGNQNARAPKKKAGAKPGLTFGHVLRCL